MKSGLIGRIADIYADLGEAFKAGIYNAWLHLKHSLIKDYGVDPKIKARIDTDFQDKFGDKDSEPEPQKRTRSDAIKTAMNAYLDVCKAEDKRPDIDGCWRFAADRQGIEENHNGDLAYPIRGGKAVKTVNRKQFSDRFNNMLRDR